MKKLILLKITFLLLFSCQKQRMNADINQNRQILYQKAYQNEQN